MTLTDKQPMPPATLITGATSGIGEAFARQLAARGHHLILVARRGPALQQLCDELTQQYAVQCRFLARDLSASRAAQQLAETLTEKQWPLNGLINNAGCGYFGDVQGMPAEKLQAMIQLNITTLSELCIRLLPLLLQQPAARIINVGSTGGTLPGAGVAAYYASKSYVNAFSRALAEELRQSQVHVSCLTPGTTRTDFFRAAGARRSGLLARSGMTPEQVVSHFLRQQHLSFVVPGTTNKLLVLLSRLLPHRWLIPLLYRLQKPSV